MLILFCVMILSCSLVIKLFRSRKSTVVGKLGLGLYSKLAGYSSFELMIDQSLTCYLVSSYFPPCLQTTNTAALLIYEIAKHPELQERLVQEISSVVGDKKHPTWDDLQKMTLVRNCVKESMRLTPPGPINLRSIPEDTVLMGYHVPAGVS